MAWSYSSNHGHGSLSITTSLVLLFMVLSLASWNCHCLGTFGFNIHHRFSDPVKEILGIDELPHKGSPQYYAAMVHRDRIFRSRRLAADHHKPLTFAAGNHTIQIGAFGQYGNSSATCSIFLFYLLFSLLNLFIIIIIIKSLFWVIHIFIRILCLILTID